MTRTIRTLAVKLLIGGACLAPLAVPAAAVAQDRQPVNSVPEAKKLTAKELHQKLLKTSGWIQQRDGDRIVKDGTGWVLDADRRLMVTNDHVVAGQDVLFVVFPKYKDGKPVRQEAEYRGEKGVRAVVIDRDRTRDLAVIQLDSLPDGIVALPLAADEPEETDVVRTIGGCTNGSDDLVFGGVSGEVRSVGFTGGLHGTGKVRVVLTNVPINGGNSGGPLVNEAGQLVGVNSYSVLRGPGGREVTNVSGHISVVELKGYMTEVDPLVAPKGGKEFIARGERKMKAGRFDAAIKDFSAALSKDEKNADALYQRGKAFTELGDAATALDDLNAAVKADVNRYEYRLARGKALRALGKADEAMADFSAAIRSDPAQWEGYNQRGILHFRAGKFADAETDFDRALTKEPGVAVLWANRAEARYGLKDYPAAVQDWAKACDLDPTATDHVYKLGVGMVAAGKPDAAVDLYLDAAQKYGDPLFLTRAGVVLLNAGDSKGAAAAYTAAIKGYGDKGLPADVGMAYLGRGIAQHNLKNLKEAIGDLSNAVELTGGKNAQAYYERGLAHQANGDATAAAADFAAAEKLGWKADKPVKKADKPLDPPPADPLVGKWKMTTAVNGLTLTQVIEFSADGTWEANGTLSNGFASELASDTGTWKLEKGKLTLAGKTTGTVVRTIRLDGDAAEVVMDEIAQTVTFKRVK